MEKHFIENALNNISLQRYDKALSDLRKSIRFNEYSETSYVLKIQVCLNLGDFDGIEEGVNELKCFFPNNEIIKTVKKDINKYETFVKQAFKFSIQKKYNEAIKQINSALQLSTHSLHLSYLKNQYMIDEMEQIKKACALYKTACWLYGEADLEACSSQLSNLVYVDPYHKDAEKLKLKNDMLKKQNYLGDSLVKAFDFLKAIEIYSEAIKIDATNKKMISVFHTKLAAINLHILKYSEASICATNALEFNPENIDALIIRAECYSKLHDFENCIKDCNLVLTVDNNDYIKSLLDENSLFLFVKVTSARAYLNFDEHRMLDCIFNCEAILKAMEKLEIRNLLENATECLITQTMESARHLYTTEQYEVCMSQCDILIDKFPNVVEATNLKASAENHKSLIESISNAKQMYQEHNYKECLKLCNQISFDKVNERKDQYRMQVDQMLQSIREEMDAVKDKADLNFTKMNFNECIKDLEYLLSIEESQEIEDFIKRAKSEMSFEKRLANSISLFKAKKYVDCIEYCKSLLLVRQVDELKQLIVDCEIEIEKQNKINEIINKNMRKAENNFEQKNYEECIEDCLKLLEQINSCKEAKTLLNKALNEIIFRAISHSEKAQYKECKELCLYIKRTQNVYVLENENFFKVKKLLQESKEALEYEHKTNSYDILKVAKGADIKTITKGFYKISLAHHPDKHVNSTEEMKIYCGNLYKKITAAYTNLCNPEKNKKKKK